MRASGEGECRKTSSYENHCTSSNEHLCRPLLSCITSVAQVFNQQLFPQLLVGSRTREGSRHVGRGFKSASVFEARWRESPEL